MSADDEKRQLREQQRAERERQFKAEREKARRHQKKIEALYTTESTSLLLTKIAKLFGKQPCPMCGTMLRTIMCDELGRPCIVKTSVHTGSFSKEQDETADAAAALITASIMEAFYGPRPPDRELVSFAIVCTGCGLTTLHHAGMLGMLDLDDEKQSKPKLTLIVNNQESG